MLLAFSLVLSPSVSLSVSFSSHTHEYTSVLSILVYLDWVCPSVRAFVCIFLSLHCLNSVCMSASRLYVCPVTPSHHAYVDLFGRKCLSVHLSSPCVFVSICTVSGSAGGGECRLKHHPGGGEGTQSQRQRAGPDALPGGSTALPVHI